MYGSHRAGPTGPKGDTGDTGDTAGPGETKMKTLLLPAPAHCTALYTERQAAYTRAVHQMCSYNEAIIESGCYLLSACYYYY